MTVPTDPLPAADGTRDRGERSQWFWDHYGKAAQEVLDFLGGDGISLENADMADVGTGDGMTLLGIADKAQPRRAVGFDLVRTDAARLLEEAQAEGVAETGLPACVSFERSEETRIPAEDASFDLVLSWSAFEHVLDPVPVLREIRRILRPTGSFMLQLWPFYYSEHGSHLWHWFPDGFANLRHSDEAIAERLRADETTDPAWLDVKLHDNRTLNRITLDELGRCINVAGMSVTKLEILSHAVHLTPELNRYDLSDLAISGVKLLASPLR